MKVSLADFANLSLLRIPGALRAKLERAQLMPTEAVPPDIVTMLTRVRLVKEATGERKEIEIVYPGSADPAAGRVSVLEGLGIALFGSAVGETIRYEAAEGPCQLRIEAILYQPEHWMRINLVVRE